MTRIPARRRQWSRRLALALAAIAIFLLVRLGLQWFLPDLKAGDSVAVNSQAPQAPVQFDFYTVLPKMAVTVASAADNVAGVTAKPAAAAAKPLQAGAYVLQIAALRQFSDAQRLRDQIQSTGYPVFIQAYQAGQMMWYRVMVGPYVSQELAERAQIQLKNHHFNSLLLKMQPRSV